MSSTASYVLVDLNVSHKYNMYFKLTFFCAFWKGYNPLLPTSIINCNFFLARLFPVYRPLICSDPGDFVLSSRSSYHPVCGLLLWIWLHSVDAPDTVYIYPSVQLWRADVAESVQQVTTNSTQTGYCII